MTKAGELITVDGTIVSTDVPFARAVLAARGAEDRRIDHTGKLEIDSNGRRIEVICPPRLVVRPERDIAGPWREIQRHPVGPTGEFHPDGHVELTGVWLVPGDLVRVIGRAIAHGFVDGTGGHREAPEQEVIGVEAVAIGVGDDRDGHARSALAAAERASRQRPPAIDPRRLATLVVRGFVAACLVFAVAAIGAELVWARGTLGLAMVALHLAALWTWWASPLAPFPGGAKDPDDEVRPATLALLVGTAGCVAPIWFFLPDAETALGRDAAASLTVTLVGSFATLITWVPVLIKPRAVPGQQTYLPENFVVRWCVLFGLLVTTVASALVLAVHAYLF